MKHLLVKAATALAAVPLLLLVVQDGSAVSSTNAAASPRLVAQARAHMIKVMSAHATAIGTGSWVSPGAKVTTVPPTATVGGASALQSANWDGFGDSESGSKTFTAVSGTWQIPAVQCLPAPYQNQDAFLADWVGLDGLTNGTVEQLGTATQCYEGVEYYYVWYEMYPAGMVEEGTTACINDNVDCPQPGDFVSASVTVTKGAKGVNKYVLALTDHTRPVESFSVNQTCKASVCADASAEWVVERPAFAPPFGIQILPLGDFTKSIFTAGSVTSGGVTTTSGGFKDGPVYDIMMVDDSDSYILACNDQPAPAGSLLLTSQAHACPTVAPFSAGGFTTSWDSSF
jgi:Peptidase A4 family